MASNSTVEILGPDGSSQVNTTIGDIDAIYTTLFVQTVSLASQMGALFIMLVVVLVMTPKARFKVLPTMLSIAALAFHLVRITLLAIYNVSHWNRFSPQILGDLTSVHRVDYNSSIVATVFGIPVTILIELCLIVQAWSMIRLWSKAYRAFVGLVSFGIVAATIVFNFVMVIVQVRFILYNIMNLDWVISAYYIIFTTSISWFCFVFIIRIVIHMWEKRTILPSIRGLNPMDVVVMANGVLMVIPIIFASMRWSVSINFYAFSLCQTSVVLVLPLGSMVAQRLSNPSAVARPPTPNTANVGSNVSGMGSLASKRPLLRRSSNASSGASFRPGQVNNGVTPGVTSEACFEKSETRHLDQELARIDDTDLERGLGGVRVDRPIESSEERVPSTTDMGRGHDSS